LKASSKKWPDKATARVRLVSWPVRVFIVVHVAMVAIWALPQAPEGVREKRVRPFGSDYLLDFTDRNLKNQPAVRTYMMVPGFWQYWDMFSPNPSQTDVYGGAKIRFTDGHEMAYPYHRIWLLPIPQKYGAERYRKFFERVRRNRASWGPFTDRVFRWAKRYEPGREVAWIEIQSHSRRIPPPGNTVGPYVMQPIYRRHFRPEATAGEGG
jgi:hypothetical protein